MPEIKHIVFNQTHYVSCQKGTSQCEFLHSNYINQYANSKELTHFCVKIKYLNIYIMLELAHNFVIIETFCVGIKWHMWGVKGCNKIDLYFLQFI